MGVLGVTEWENLGYRDSDMMGRPGNLDPRNFWQADLDEAARPPDLARSAATSPTSSRPTTSSAGTATPTTSASTTCRSARIERAGDPAWYPEQLAERRRRAVWDSPSKLYEQAIPASVRTAMTERLRGARPESFWLPPEDATPEQIAEFEAYAAKMLVPDERITTWVDIRRPASAQVGRASTST